MFEIHGKYGFASVYADMIDEETVGQIQEIVNQKMAENSSIRIMPDCHYGKGAVVGLTMKISEKVVPSFVGVDIGCGMLVVELGNILIDLPSLDSFIRNYIPYGSKVHKTVQEAFSITNLKCYPQLTKKNELERSLGTLGGGNHFIEIDRDKKGILYLIIHSGSRSLGKEVGELYQKKAIAYQIAKEMHQEDMYLSALKKKGKKAYEMEELLYRKGGPSSISKAYCYLEGDLLKEYLHDMDICQEFAKKNRIWMAKAIISFLGLSWQKLTTFECVHNYIAIKDMILRKGAISAYEGEKVLIPINMRDGCILGMGKSNEAYNYSAPHGAGRLLSRKESRLRITLEEYQKTMEGIYSSSISDKTLDESPMAYKPLETILENIQETVSVIDILQPIYNFKAS